MIPRKVPAINLKKCRRCGYEVEATEVNSDDLCPTCEEYLCRLSLKDRARRGYRVPTIPPPRPWPAALVEAVLKILKGV